MQGSQPTAHRLVAVLGPQWAVVGWAGWVVSAVEVGWLEGEEFPVPVGECWLSGATWRINTKVNPFHHSQE